MITNRVSNTRIDEVADGIYRISTPVGPELLPGGFTFNQYLIRDDRPLLFHTGPRKMFPLVREAIDAILPSRALAYVAFSHFEADECGSLDLFLEQAPEAVPVCSRVAAMVNISDISVRPARALADGEALSLGRHEVRWMDAPHLPHGWDCGYLFDDTTRTLLCGDLFTQPGATHDPVTTGDILGPSEVMRKGMDYFAHGPDTRAQIERLAALQPETLACMHGSAWRGDGASLLRALGDAVTA